jgi:alkylation response protein AidB-like acyl-CoA dehydrogenase
MQVSKLPSGFGFDKDHELLRQSTRRLLGERNPMERVRKLDTDATGYDAALYKEMAELGWLGLALPESCGGADLGYLSLSIVLEEMGRALLPGPFLSSVLAGLALVEADAADRCEGIASGEQIATIALTEPEASWLPESVTATATDSGGEWVLDGVKTHVMWGGAADLLVAPFRAGDEVALFAVELPTDRVTVTDEVCVDTTRRTSRIAFDGARVPASARLAGAGIEKWRALFIKGYAMLAAEMVGGAERVLGITRDYAIERIQFNRPIGSFQAVKHPIVNVMLAIEAARSHTAAAAAVLDTAPKQAEVPARMAKAAATDTYSFACGRGIQLHGGFGFTYDCDVHFYFKRAMWSAATLGDALHHRRALAAALFS